MRGPAPRAARRAHPETGRWTRRRSTSQAKPDLRTPRTVPLTGALHLIRKCDHRGRAATAAASSFVRCCHRLPTVGVDAPSRPGSRGAASGVGRRWLPGGDRHRMQRRRVA
ncbi:hypothetical protein FHS42_006836 [Streptomyces zagrosensis]|uniref:Uncharacterized protein n=1 Tax=Streptomyces zagrosensis TaxID=1042984 RepID=A0A7W9QGB4_9ACTN|nr:hypothetical protein [Streptomyces zagrosensis]